MALHVLVTLALLAVATATRLDSDIQRQSLVGSDVTDLLKNRGDLRCCCDANGQTCHIMYYALRGIQYNLLERRKTSGRLAGKFLDTF